MKINGLSELSRESYRKLSLGATNYYIKHTLVASAPLGFPFCFPWRRKSFEWPEPGSIERNDGAALKVVSGSQYCHIRHINQSGHTDCNKYAARHDSSPTIRRGTAGVCVCGRSGCLTTIFQTWKDKKKGKFRNNVNELKFVEARQLATGVALTYRMMWHELGITSSVRGDKLFLFSMLIHCCVFSPFQGSHIQAQSAQHQSIGLWGK